MIWYQPKHFCVAERGVLIDAIRAYPFATLITVADGQCAVTHLPLVVEDTAQGIELLGHVARANPHWTAWSAGTRATAIFHGPGAYVSPSLYPSTRRAVPTWNYIAIHAEGRLRVEDSAPGKERILKALIDAHEPAYRAQWDVLEPEFRESLKQATVGFTIAADRIDGKFKLSQNRPPADQAAVRAAHAVGAPAARQLAQWMARLGIGAPGE